MAKSSTCIEKGKINTFRSRKATRASVNYDSPVRPHSEQGPLPPCWQTEAPARYPGTRLSSHAHRIFGFISPLISGNFCPWLFSLLFVKCSDVALSGTHTSLLFITMPWTDLLLQTAVSPIRWTHSSLLSAPHISRKISVPFLSPWSVYRLLPGRTWFHCAFNKDSAAPLVTALDLVTGLEWGRWPCSGGHATETQVPMAKLRRTVDPGGSSTHLGQDRKSPESGNRHPTLSELGSNRLHSTFLPAELQTLKVSEFPKITNFTQPPDRLFMFQKNSRFLNLNSFVNILPRGPRYKSTFHFSSI